MVTLKADHNKGLIILTMITLSGFNFFVSIDLDLVSVLVSTGPYSKPVETSKIRFHD